ncbi:MAG: hypothetical protein AVDCRST_MAG65-1437, partial [uncultured Solirubrobacteraceae bacterium]
GPTRAHLRPHLRPGRRDHRLGDRPGGHPVEDQRGQRLHPGRRQRGDPERRLRAL